MFIGNGKQIEATTKGGKEIVITAGSDRRTQDKYNHFGNHGRTGMVDDPSAQGDKKGKKR